MKIIKRGHKTESPKTNALFKCYECGCEWLANIVTECKSTRHEYYGYTMYVCNCPDCSKENITTRVTTLGG